MDRPQEALEKARRRMEAAEHERGEARAAYGRARSAVRAARRDAGLLGRRWGRARRRREWRAVVERETDGARREWRRQYGDIAGRLRPFATYHLLPVARSYLAFSEGTLAQARERAMAAGLSVGAQAECALSVQGLDLTRHAHRLTAVDPSDAELRWLASGGSAGGAARGRRLARG